MKQSRGPAWPDPELGRREVATPPRRPQNPTDSQQKRTISGEASVGVFGRKVNRGSKTILPWNQILIPALHLPAA